MKNLLLVFTAFTAISTLNSCCFGTLNNALTHGKSTVSMMRAPKDLEVSSNGTKLDITSEVFAASSNIGGSVTTTYYTSAVKLPAKHKTTIELYSPSMNKRATVELKPRSNRNIIWLDIIFGAGSGLLIDIPTGNLKMLTPRLLDTQSALEGKPRSKWLSHAKLKRMAKRKAKHG
ncbi:MAG: hypothetical protein JWQ38_808 [Flavipsychrobacter sp.]|nr:hypothetical protein [Flavipsychrobacter sp.]